MNGIDSTVKDVIDLDVFFTDKMSACMLCNGYYSHNHEQPMCRTCHLFLCPSFLPFYTNNIKKCDLCDSGNEDGDNPGIQDSTNLPYNNEESSNIELERRLEEMSAVQPHDNNGNNYNAAAGDDDDPMQLLPNEVLTKVFRYLDDLSIWTSRNVCRRWRHIVESEFSDVEWRAFVMQRWPLFQISSLKCLPWKSTYKKLYESSSCLYCLQNQIISDNLTMTKESTWRYTRLQNEMRNSCADPLDGIDAVPLDDCLFNWQASIAGPRGSPYEGGLFFLHLQILPDYPLRPPLVHFTTKIFHPNVSRHGDIGLDCINDNWSLALTITKILISIQSLLTDPYSYVCMEPTIGKLYQQNRSLYEKVARFWTQKYAVYNVS